MEPTPWYKQIGLTGVFAIAIAVLLVATTLTNITRSMTDALPQALPVVEQHEAVRIAPSEIGVVYDEDRLIVDILHFGEKLEAKEGQTIERYESDRGTYGFSTPIAARVQLDAYGDGISYNGNLWIDMTDEEAIGYLNSRPEASRMLENPAVRHSYTIAAAATADVEARINRAFETGAVPELKFAQSGETEILTDEETLTAFKQIGSTYPEYFDFSCKITPLEAVNVDEVTGALKSLFMPEGVSYSLAVRDVAQYRQLTREPCYYFGPLELLPPSSGA